MAQVLTTDMTLTALVTIATFSLYLHWHEGGRWCWIAYVAMGLAVMTKGPVGAALPILSMLIWLALNRELRGAIARFRAVPGLLLTTLIAAPWFVAMTIREPGFADFYFIGEHLRRSFEADYSHSEAFYFYHSSARDRIAAVDVAGAVPHLARGSAQSRAEFLPGRGERHDCRFLMREREADPVHPAGGPSARRADRRRTRVMRMAGGRLARRAPTAGFADSHRERADAGAVGRGRDRRGDRGAAISHSLRDGGAAGACTRSARSCWRAAQSRC